MTKTITLRLFASAALTLAFLSNPLLAQRDATAPLRYQFKEGDESKYKLHQTVVTDMTPPGGQGAVQTVMEQTTFMSNATKSVNKDGSGVQTQIITRIVMKLSGSTPGVQALDIDTDKEEDPTDPNGKMIMSMLRPMVGEEFQQTVKTTGQIENIVIPEKVVKAMKSNPAAGALGDMATPEGIKKMTSQAAVVFPEKTPEIGDEWSETVDIKLPFGTMSTKRNSTYLGKSESKMDRLRLSTDVLFKADAGSPVALTITNNDGSGEILFDCIRGRVFKSELHQVTQMNIKVQGQSIDQQVTTDVLLELVNE